jgi:hypothetical protein
MPTAIKTFPGTRLALSADNNWNVYANMAIVPNLKPGELGVALPVHIVKREMNGRYSYAGLGAYRAPDDRSPNYVDYRA